MLALILLIVAAVCFALAVFGVAGRVNLIAAGLFCWVTAVVLERLG